MKRNWLLGLVFSSASVIAFAASVFSATPAAASSVCYGGFSSFTVSVCGDIEIKGGGANGNLNVQKDSQRFDTTSVSLNGAAGGTGVGALTSVSGSFGEAHITSSAFDTDAAGAQSGVLAIGYLSFVDGFTVGSNI